MLDGFMKGSRKMASLAWLRRLAGDRRGVAAVEFALIAPILLSLYFVTMEVAQGIETNKKVGRVASMVADLVTQQPTVTTGDLDGIMMIGEAILQPYNRSRPTIEITAIKLTDETNPKAEVEWSRTLSDGATAPGAAIGSLTTVPETLRTPGAFLVRVSGRLDYRPVITWTADQKANLGLAGAFDRIQMRETYFLRPRMTLQIDCDDC